jgi:hypothetical protein
MGSKEIFWLLFIKGISGWSMLHPEIPIKSPAMGW